MAIRVSGLVSGLDTDSIVQELVSAYSKKKDKHVKAQTKLEWKMEAWKDLNKKVNSLYKKLGNMKLSTYYNKKKTTISDSTKATVSASNNAINGTQTLKITNVASAGYLTGGQLEAGTTASTTLGELGLTSGKGTIALTTKGTTSNIEVSSDMTISDFVYKLKDAGVSANYDATQRRIYVSARDSGVENDFSLTAADPNGLEALKKLGLYVNSDADKAAYMKWSDYVVDASGNSKYTKDADGNVIENTSFNTSEAEAATKTKFETILKNIDKYNGDDPDSISGLKTEITKLQADRNYATALISMKAAIAAEDEDGNARLTVAEQEELEGLIKTDTEGLSDDDIVTMETRISELQEKLGYTDADMAQLRSNATAVRKFETDPDNADSEWVSNLEDAYKLGSKDDINAELQRLVDDNSAQIQENSKEINRMQKYINDNVMLTSAAPADGTYEERAQALWDRYDYMTQADADYSKGAKKNDGTDAEIVLNGVTYRSASNNITVNGLTVTALQRTAPDEELTISTQTDAQGIYDSIKDFLKEYNALIKEMDELFNAASSKGYEPLTDDEKDAMSDKEVEKWEKKIKDSILRRDDTLSSVMSLMTTSMSQGFTLSDGKRYSLSSFGIKTQGYLYSAENEGYVYHIDGDSEDEVSSGNADRLLAAIQENPEMVQEFFQKLSDDLYTKLDKKMQSSSLNTKFSIYHDKQMQKEYDQYTATIKKWEDKVTSMEDYYYKKFSAMEKALSQLQSSTSALSGLLGS